MTKTKNSTHFDLIPISTLWHKAWEIFSEHFLKFLAVTVIPVLMFNVFQWLGLGSTVFSVNFLQNPMELLDFSKGYIYFLIILLLVLFFIHMIGTIALFLQSGKYNEYGIIQTFKNSFSLFWPFLLMSVLIGLIELLGLMVGYLLVALFGAVLGLFGQEILNLYFSWLLAIPFLINGIISIFVIFSPYLVIIKKMNAIKAIKESFMLVKGHFFAITFRLFTLYFAISLILIILSFIPAVGYIIGAFISLPFLIIYTFVLFKNLTEVKQIQ
ncbi:MAG: hypothetical protein ABID45_04185 [Patescibacteria group bacterium]